MHFRNQSMNGKTSSAATFARRNIFLLNICEKIEIEEENDIRKYSVLNIAIE